MNAILWNKIRYTIYLPFYDLVVFVLARHRKKSISQLNIKQNDKVLVLGAGTGLDLNYLPKYAQVTATDITPGMIAILVRRAERLGMNVNAHVMDGQALEFDDESFDHVILHLIIAVIPDPIKCIKETERVLKTGGTVAVFDKFLQRGNKASALRKTFNIFTKAFFSDINRRIEDIISNTSLRIEQARPVAFRGNFRIMLLRKT